MTRFLVDTAVVVRARGGEHRHREPCQERARRRADGRLRGEASVAPVPEGVEPTPDLVARHPRPGAPAHAHVAVPPG